MNILKTSLLVAGAAIASAAAAEITTPEFYSENFVKMGQEGDYLTDGWYTYGNGATPSSDMTNYFNADGSGPYYILLNYGSQCIPFSCTNFTPSTAADQWLVTPEIEIPSDNVELSFTAAVYCLRGLWGQGKNPYKVLVSENGGFAKEDFSEVPVLEATVSGSRTQEIATRDVVCPLNGFGGKKVRLAFVSTGEDLGMTGFTNISLGNYAVTLDNKTPKVTEMGKQVTVSVNVGMKTPVACPGFTATLDLDGEKVETYYKKPFGNTGNVLIYQLVKFDPITIDGEKTRHYTVTITPDYEGAPSTVLTGSIGVPTFSYPANVVVEEVTATGCQACPSGTASLQYYTDNYPGNEEGLNKFIGIAIHGFINYYDPMSEGTAEYLLNTMDLNGTTSYPQAMFNRATRGLTPDRRAEFAKQMEAGSYNLVKITGVSTDATEENPWGKTVKVDFEARNAYDADGIDIRAAAVMIENNVTGNDSGYTQTNGFYNRTESYISSNYGDFLLPYMKKYLSGGEWGVEMIPFSKMVYHHVARGIWPSFYGEPMAGAWVKDEARAGTLEFKVPEAIHNLKETEVIVLLIDGESNAIVASDIIPASEYGALSGVANVADSGVSVSRNGNEVTVCAESGEAVVYTPDGIALARVEVKGSARIAVPAGVVIVKVADSDGVQAFKLR
ncbi:MAG: choice-of-anchor J domain-containing protein [Muribaculaceae bacterium]|nr:choice-of-anchor J domain-containing protein [Muribaculaceae bacterium]